MVRRKKDDGQKEEFTLAPFEGKPVLSASVSVTNAGDGLSNALAVEPIEMHVGETGIIALEYEVAKVRFDPIKDTPGLQRVHILRAGTATFIDEKTVAMALEQQKARIEAAAGIFHLPGIADGEGAEPVKPDDMTDEEWEASGRQAAIDAAAAGDGDDGEGE